MISLTPALRRILPALGLLGTLCAPALALGQELEGWKMPTEMSLDEMSREVLRIHQRRSALMLKELEREQAIREQYLSQQEKYKGYQREALQARADEIARLEENIKSINAQIDQLLEEAPLPEGFFARRKLDKILSEVQEKRERRDTLERLRDGAIRQALRDASDKWYADGNPTIPDEQPKSDRELMDIRAEIRQLDLRKQALDLELKSRQEQAELQRRIDALKQGRQ